MGPCPCGVSTSGIKADFFKSSGREALRAPGQPRASSDTPGTPGMGSMSRVHPATSDRGRVVLVISSTPGNGFWLPSLWLEGRWHLMGSPAVGGAAGPRGEARRAWRKPDHLNLNVFSLSVSCCFRTF